MKYIYAYFKAKDKIIKGYMLDLENNYIYYKEDNVRYKTQLNNVMLLKTTEMLDMTGQEIIQGSIIQDIKTEDIYLVEYNTNKNMFLGLNLDRDGQDYKKNKTYIYLYKKLSKNYRVLTNILLRPDNTANTIKLVGTKHSILTTELLIKSFGLGACFGYY